MLAMLDDTHHAMWLVLEHDGHMVTGVSGAFTRQPATPCGGAVDGLRALVGMPLDAAVNDLRRHLPFAENCTHLADLSVSAMRPVHRRTGSTCYDIVIPDAGNTPRWIEIARNARPVHRWAVSGTTIVAPEPLAGRPLLGKFTRWARETFSGDDLDAAMMLQRGVFVARALPYHVDPSPPIPLRDYGGIEGACFSYSGANWRTATGAQDFVRDFTNGVTPQKLPAHVADAFELEPKI
ncbi:DUF2889 domain-containing protein [Sphingomonas sp. CL5.1]|nr:DUF2889 domain-containing protein [Sphingomonas sp. CL5.1]